MKRNKGGRPEKREDEKLVKLDVRIPKEIKEKLKEKSILVYGGNFSLCVRNTLNDNLKTKVKLNSEAKNIEQLVDRTELYALIRSYNKIGNNLNQLTRLANSGRIQYKNLEATIHDINGLHNSLFDLLVDKLNENNPNFN